MIVCIKSIYRHYSDCCTFHCSITTYQDATNKSRKIWKGSEGSCPSGESEEGQGCPKASEIRIHFLLGRGITPPSDIQTPTTLQPLVVAHCHVWQIYFYSHLHFIVSHQAHAKIKQDEPNASFGEVSKKISAQWKELSDNKKAKFLALSEKDKLRFAAEKEAYVPSLGFGSDGKALAVGKGGKAKRAKKDKNLPKGALSSYIIFCTQMRSVIKTETPGTTTSFLYFPVVVTDNLFAVYAPALFLMYSFSSCCRYRQHRHYETDWWALARDEFWTEVPLGSPGRSRQAAPRWRDGRLQRESLSFKQHRKLFKFLVSSSKWSFVNFRLNFPVLYSSIQCDLDHSFIWSYLVLLYF